MCSGAKTPIITIFVAFKPTLNRRKLRHSATRGGCMQLQLCMNEMTDSDRDAPWIFQLRTAGTWEFGSRHQNLYAGKPP